MLSKAQIAALRLVERGELFWQYRRACNIGTASVMEFLAGFNAVSRSTMSVLNERGLVDLYNAQVIAGRGRQVALTPAGRVALSHEVQP